MNSSVSYVAIGLFLAVIAVTLVITYWAAKRSHTTSEIYAAGGNITAWQNGWAIAGDILSAATLFGGVGMFYYAGYDAMLYSFPVLLGMLITLGFVAGPMRKLGRFTFADAVAARLSPIPIRILAALSTLAVLIMYLTAQMLGAGGLIEVLFGIPYEVALVIVGALMVIYVAIGGMLATTWVQIIKAVLLVTGVSILALLVLAQHGYSLDALYNKASAVHTFKDQVLQPGGLGLSPLDAASLSLALAFGIPGMPHLLMRFFTVPDPKTARRSAAVAASVMGFTYAAVYLVIGPAGVALITNNSDYATASGGVQGGTNMVVLHLARTVGGDVLFGLIAAVAFSTILAVVAGVTVSAASAISHDLYKCIFARKETTQRQEIMIFRASCVFMGVLGIGMGVAFKGQNILFLTGLLFSIAASSCFPVLVMSMFWRPLTTVGAVAGGYVGLGLSVALIIIGPNVWVQILGNPTAILPLTQPSIISVPAAFATMIVVSLLTRRARPAAT